MAGRSRYRFIAPELESLVVPIDRVRPHPDNPRLHDIDRIRESVRKHGQSTPLTVHAQSALILKGNGTYAAMLELGATHIAAVFKHVDAQEAQAYLLDDNHASDGARYDEGLRLEMLETIDLDLTTFTELDVQEIRSRLTRDSRRRLGDFGADGEPPQLRRWRLTGGRALDAIRSLHEACFRGEAMHKSHCLACDVAVEVERLLDMRPHDPGAEDGDAD